VPQKDRSHFFTPADQQNLRRPHVAPSGLRLFSGIGHGLAHHGYIMPPRLGLKCTTEACGIDKKLGPSTCRFCRKCISVNALRTDVCFEDAWGPSMGLRRTGLGLRSLWRLCLRGTAKEFVRLRCFIRRRFGQACRGVRCGLRSTCGRGHCITSS
jgi:hypothetical protein